MAAGPQPVSWALFSLKGRIRRATFALGSLLLFSIWWVCLAQALAFSEGSEGNERWAITLGLVVLASAYCLYALSHKRLQDIGYPGWYALAVPVIQFIFPPVSPLAFLTLALYPGQADDNEWGPPPVSPEK